MIRSLSVLSAGVVALTMSGAASADNDLMRLDGKGDAEVQETRYYGGGFRGGVGYGGYRGGYGGYRGGYGGYGGYRGFGGYGRGYGGYYGRGFGYGYGRGYYGGYRPYYGFGYGLGLGLGYASYYGGGYGGYGGGYGGYYNSYYSTPYYSSSYGLCPCATDTNFPSATNLNLVSPNGSQAPWDGTFPYNGGPQDGYFAPAPAGMPNRTNAPRDGHLVSVPASSSGYQFLAFGEQPAPADQRPATDNSGDLLRVSYPAYGEAPTGFSGGTTIYPAMTR